VIGDRSSSNSNRLREIAASSGVPAYLVLDAAGIDVRWLAGVRTVGVTSGASTPEVSVRSVVEHLRALGAGKVEEIEGVREDIEFSLPALVR
jgi:4-hydroxy-3-methylbut-2-enyl diphosphate reductase